MYNDVYIGLLFFVVLELTSCFIYAVLCLLVLSNRLYYNCVFQKWGFWDITSNIEENAINITSVTD